MKAYIPFTLHDFVSTGYVHAANIKYNKDYGKPAFIDIILDFRSYRNGITKIMTYNKCHAAFLHHYCRNQPCEEND